MRLLLCLFFFIPSIAIAAPPSLWLEELTAPEVAAALAEGYTTILIPTAGTEPNGPHLPLDKHRIVITYTAEQIARATGYTLIAPVIVYVPEATHADIPGTISLSEDTFEALLTDTIASLIRGGFTTIAMIGDSGGNQEIQERVASATRQPGAQVASIRAYYHNRQADWLHEQGFSGTQIGAHAGMRETAELLAIAPETVRKDRIKDVDIAQSGDASLATAALGRTLLKLKIDPAVAALRALREGPAQ